MNRAEFMERLQGLLEDIPQEEREDAIQYYNDYLDDTGAENENAALAALGSPERIADSIRIGLQDGENFGEFTEEGFRMDEGEKREPVPVSGWAEKTDGEKTAPDEKGSPGNEFHYGTGNEAAGPGGNGYGGPAPGMNGSGSGPYGSGPSGFGPGGPGGPGSGGPGPGKAWSGPGYGQSQYASGQYHSGPYSSGAYGQNLYGQNQYGQNPCGSRPEGNNPPGPNGNAYGPERSKGRGTGEVILMILACIFLLPILIPLGLGAVIIAFLFLLCVLIFFACMVIGGVTVLAVGGAMVFFSVANLTVFPASAVCILGGGLVCVGIGLLLTLLMCWFAVKTVPALCRGFVNLCSLPFRRKKREA